MWAYGNDTWPPEGALQTPWYIGRLRILSSKFLLLLRSEATSDKQYASAVLVEQLGYAHSI